MDGWNLVVVFFVFVALTKGHPLPEPDSNQDIIPGVFISADVLKDLQNKAQQNQNGQRSNQPLTSLQDDSVGTNQLNGNQLKINPNAKVQGTQEQDSNPPILSNQQNVQPSQPAVLSNQNQQVITPAINQPQPSLTPQPNQQVWVQQPAGNQLLVPQPNGSPVLVQQPNGNQFFVQPNGNQIFVQQPNGNQVLVQPPNGNQLLVQQPNGNQLLIQQPNGNQLLVQPNGNQLLVQPNGNQLLVQPNGNQLLVQPNGNQLLVQPNGNQLLVQPNGNQLIVQPNGNQLLVQPNNNQYVVQRPLPNNIYVNQQPGNQVLLQPRSQFTSQQPQPNVNVNPNLQIVLPNGQIAQVVGQPNYPGNQIGNNQFTLVQNPRPVNSVQNPGALYAVVPVNGQTNPNSNGSNGNTYLVPVPQGPNVMYTVNG